MIERNGGSMSVIVKGMKMPKNCLHCDFDDSYGICACRNESPYVCEYSAKQRPSWCPLEEVPSAQPETHEERTETHACDSISRQAAIDAILAVTGNSSVRELYEHVQEHGLSDMWSGGVNAAIDIIIAVPSAQPDMSEYSDKLWKAAYERGRAEAQQRWIPCSERLPAYGEDVLISIGGYCNVGYIVSVNEEEQYNWYFSGWYHLPNDVDAWMPLPEPYREEGD